MTYAEACTNLRQEISAMLSETGGRITAAIADARCTLWFCEAQDQNEVID